MNKIETISIITPCKNAGRFLSDTLELLYQQTALKKQRVLMEHIIVDGDSIDNTSAILSEFPASSVICEKDSGMYDAVAKGLKIAKGDIIGYLNAGDILFPWAFDVLIDIF